MNQNRWLNSFLIDTTANTKNKNTYLIGKIYWELSRQWDGSICSLAPKAFFILLSGSNTSRQRARIEEKYLSISLNTFRLDYRKNIELRHKRLKCSSLFEVRFTTESSKKRITRDKFWIDNLNLHSVQDHNSLVYLTNKSYVKKVSRKLLWFHLLVLISVIGKKTMRGFLNPC